MIGKLAFQDTFAPVVALTAPMPMWATEFSWVNRPAGITRLLSGESTIAFTASLAFGAQVVRAPALV